MLEPPRGICTKYPDYSFTVKCNRHRTTPIQCVTKGHAVFWRMLMTVQIVPAPPMFCIHSPGLTCMRYICTCLSSDAHRYRCVNNPNRVSSQSCCTIIDDERKRLKKKIPSLSSLRSFFEPIRLSSVMQLFITWLTSFCELCGRYSMQNTGPGRAERGLQRARCSRDKRY